MGSWFKEKHGVARTIHYRSGINCKFSPGESIYFDNEKLCEYFRQYHKQWLDEITEEESIIEKNGKLKKVKTEEKPVVTKVEETGVEVKTEEKPVVTKVEETGVEVKKHKPPIRTKKIEEGYAQTKKSATIAGVSN